MEGKDDGNSYPYRRARSKESPGSKKIQRRRYKGKKIPIKEKKNRHTYKIKGDKKLIKTNKLIKKQEEQDCKNLRGNQ